MTEYEEIAQPKFQLTFQDWKIVRAILLGCARSSGIKRTRKRQIAKAKHMMDFYDHTSYEWSQWWKQNARKPKRWKK